MTPQRHLGELVRLLREAAGLTRRQLGDAIGLSAMTLTNLEFQRNLPTRDTMDRLLAHPSMARLVEWALNEGIAIELRPEPLGDYEVVAILIRRRR